MPERTPGRLSVPSLFQSPVIRRVGFAVTLACASALPAAGQSVCTSGAAGELLQGRSSGLSGAVSTQTFDVLGLVSGEPIASTTVGGVTIGFRGAFSGMGPLYFPFSGFAVYSFDNAVTANSEITMTFNGPTRAAAFQFAVDIGLADDPGMATFTAWNGVNHVGSFVANQQLVGSSNAPCWWGFEFASKTFDRLTINVQPGANSTGAFGFDNLQVPTVSTVPEPSTVGLLAVGLLGLGAAVRRRTKH